MNATGENIRPNPDEMLTLLRREEETEGKGKLKIFFGMCPGVGKTYTMLQTARSDATKGVDVVVGYVESHNRSETNALLEGLTVVPRKKITYRGTGLEEMDLDAIIEMHPYLVLVDELAHTNAPGSRHLKRYQDVQELLDNGINVYTTVNVQHLESRTDTVAQITGITVRETIPDEIFEKADEVELVDITPDELLIRLAEGKVYTSGQSKDAVKNFFRKGNITALREMSLRIVADRVDKQLKSYMQQKRIEGPWKSGLHLLVLIGPSPTSAQLIRWTKNLAYTMSADWTALNVGTSQPLTESQQRQLEDNINLVKQFGGELITASGSDLVDTALYIARRENISHIVVGKSGKDYDKSFLFSQKSIVQRLIKESGKIDVYVLGSETAIRYKHKRRISFPAFTSRISEYTLAFLIMAITILGCLLINDEIGSQSVSFLLLFTVSILASFLRVGPVLLAAALGALAWDFFFIPPRFTMHINTPSNVLTFLMFFIIALLNGILTAKIRKQEQLAVIKEEQSNALYQLMKGLSGATSIREVLDAGRENIRKYFSVETCFLLQDGGNRLFPQKEIADEKAFFITDPGIADWVFRHNRKAGKFTDTLPSGEYTYYPLKGSRIKPGIIVVEQKKSFTGETAILWDTFLTQIARAMEHQYLGKMARKANFLDESDRLYKTLFNSISHELRIPVATIMGASDTLLTTDYPDAVKVELYEEIFKASKRLNRLIENLLNMSRLESGRIAVRLDWCDIHDLFNRIGESLNDELSPFHWDVVIPDSMPLVKLDFGLMEQVLYNLVYNSCQHSRPGTTIRMKTFYDNGNLVVQVMDRGPGFDPEILPHLFGKFYRGKNEKTGGVGLGLSIVKGFVEAHQGTVSAENRKNGGARITIQIPSEISYGNEQK